MTPDNPSRTLHTVSEACRRLSISRTQLWRLCKDGRLDKIKIGKAGVRITDASVSRFASLH
ncbi:helix-turn-helix domain-containing protein [Phreatobacter aquaticus]|uniref:Helix-turn-helix domain-containing protein n=1 Tax=Phreatobacter aquaticus TaxID=2570229 RepID=A0A4D7QRB3_9HYPH|nr:helix-turn-helix domain-containing protein [Phreatobacter aquaticus]QCK87457.1 helix-turn-helix domain-containing protein [Phreatobacter aquaticus]